MDKARLDGRVALVTGASRGIGEATARHLGVLGAEVVLVARSADALQSLASELKTSGIAALPIAADLTQIDALDNVISLVREAHGRLDILVNNAGVMPAAQRLERMSPDDWQRTQDLNLRAPWYLSSRAKELMDRGGVIVNVSSVAASFPSIGLGAYCVSKAAVAMLTRACALEWARNDIRVIGVVPGKVDTVLVAPIIEYSEKHDLELNPMRRIGEPDEVAQLIGFLVSDQASFVTGAMYPIDGGELVRSG